VGRPEELDLLVPEVCDGCNDPIMLWVVAAIMYFGAKGKLGPDGGCVCVECPLRKEEA
jgi:hypothetical protein